MAVTVNGVAWDITLYLAKHKIDANDVVVDGWNDEGYDVFVRDENGRPLFDNKGASRSLLRERREWPSPEIPENLRRIQRREPIEEPKPAPKPKEAPKK